ncbi:MAG: hypothetical protein HYY96_03330 [Candidatus Tectomicrobia bacterium]|nr:hypothetical protein [Candidatus Tectomicrobia bacterium]
MNPVIHAVTDSDTTSSGLGEIHPCGIVVYEDQAWLIQQSEIQTLIPESVLVSGRVMLRTNPIFDAHPYSMGPFKRVTFVSIGAWKGVSFFGTDKEVKGLHQVLYFHLGAPRTDRTTGATESILAGLKNLESLIDELTKDGEYKLSPNAAQLAKLVIKMLGKPEEEQDEEWPYRLAKDIVDAKEQ